MHTSHLQNASKCPNSTYKLSKYVGPLDSFATHLVLNISEIFSGFKVKINIPLCGTIYS
jgi:hypothetical protein